MKRSFYVVFAYTLFLVVSLTAFAQESSQAVIPLNGLDPVALIEGKEAPGKDEFSVIRGAFKYLFAGKGNQAKFEAAPERYEIRRNGECMVMPGVKTNADFMIKRRVHA